MDLSRQEFVQRVLEIVQSRFPLEKIAAAEHPFALKINGHVASLENLYRLTQLRPNDLRHQAERWIVELLRAADIPDDTVELEPVRQRIFPMIVPARGGPAAGAVHRPLIAGLHVSYAVDNDRTITYISPVRFKRWNISLEDLHELSLRNLVERSQEMSAHAAHDDDGNVNLMLFQTMDGYDASRLLLPSLHDRLRGYLGSPFVAAVPNRDILLCFRGDAATVAKLRPQIESDYARMPHQITKDLLLMTLDGIAPLDANEPDNDVE